MNIYIRKYIHEKAAIPFATVLCPVLDQMERSKDRHEGVGARVAVVWRLGCYLYIKNGREGVINLN